jgi:hypothetical protein
VRSVALRAPREPGQAKVEARSDDDLPYAKRRTAWAEALTRWKKRNRPARVYGPGVFVDRAFYEVGVGAVRPPLQPKMRGSLRGLPEA